MALMQYTVPVSQEGMKLSALVRSCLPELDAPDVRAIFQHRDIKVNGKRTGSDIRVRAGDSLQIYYMDIRSRAPEMIYSDDDILLVNKRAGLSVSAEDGDGPSLEEMLRRSGYETVIPIHRLDVQTCGLVVFARHARAAEILRKVFSDRTLDKRYTCIVRGSMKPPVASCKAYLTKNAQLGKVTIHDHEVPGARMILTGYETLDTRNGLSLLSVHLITGRTHQIRAHMAALGHPILGDDVYGDRTLNRARHVQGKLMLCSSSLTLDTKGHLPQLDGRTFSITPPFQKFWEQQEV